MTEEVAYRFIEALAAVERKGELDDMVQIFAEGCQIGTPVNAVKLHGQEGAREFWRIYRSAFRDVHSSLRNIIVAESCFALEWTVRALDTEGKTLSWEGVSVADVCAGQITRFRSYFDTKHVGDQIAHAVRAMSAGAR